MKVREILKILHEDGWKEVDQKSSNMQLKHPLKKGKVTLPRHGGDVAPTTLKSIYKRAGLEIAFSILPFI